MNSPAPLPLLGSISVDHFMATHWQRKPLLVRQAFPGFRAPVDTGAVRELAGHDDVQSRLVTATAGRWRLQHGPFEPARIPSDRRREWTLLVQGVDRHLDAVHALLAHFRFLSDARLDDVMISIAGDGGGVGPHLDSYDVFLLQAAGTRRWRIGPVGTRGGSGTDLVDGLPLKILRDFHPDQEWLLEPGDMLYLPPGWAHEGVAVGPCATWSIGFRAPSRLEFLQAWLSEQADTPGGADPRYGDAGTAATRHPARIPAGLDRQLVRWAQSWRPRKADIERFIGRYLTEPATDVWFEPPSRVPSPASFVRLASRDGLRLDRRTRMAYRGSRLFINGEDLPRPAAHGLRRLADLRRLTPRECAALLTDADLAATLREWWSHGWLVTGGPDGPC